MAEKVYWIAINYTGVPNKVCMEYPPYTSLHCTSSLEIKIYGMCLNHKVVRMLLDTHKFPLFKWSQYEFFFNNTNI